MKDLKGAIGDKKLNQLSIPGAHHAGFLTVGMLEGIQGRWALCQDSSITTNLNSGVRWLDLRIGETINGIFLTHSIASEERLKYALDEIKTWTNSNDEIVILQIRDDVDFHPLFGRSSERDNLPTKLREVFQGQLISKDDYKTKTVSELMSAGKQILVIGDSKYSSGVNYYSSWGETKTGNWGDVVRNVINWIPSKGIPAMDDGLLILGEAVVTPTFGKDISPPAKNHAELSKYLAEKLSSISGTVGAILMDFVSADTARAIVEHNKK
jgi:hypothetical protein